MLTIWGRANSVNVQKVMWCVGELDLAHERLNAGMQYGGLDAPGFLARNPNGQIPVLEDGDTVIWESNAIVRYLCAQYAAGGLWPEDPGARAAADMWMDWMLTTLYAPFVAVFWQLVRTAPEDRNMELLQSSSEKLHGAMTVLDGRLSQRRFTAGDRMTMGDIPVGATCHRYFKMDIERPDLPSLRAYYETLQERAAYRDHVMLPLT